MVTLRFRALRVDDLDAALAIRLRSFGPLDAAGEDRWRRTTAELLEQGRLHGVEDDGTLVAAGKARGFEQWWTGRRVPMAGMAGITVAPQARGRGVGSLLMRGLADLSRDRGEPVSALYPASIPVYRHLGWELAGAQRRVSLEADALRLLGGSTVVREAHADDARAIVDLYADGMKRARHRGPRHLPAAEWSELLADPQTYVFVADDGVVVYRWAGQDLEVVLLWAETLETTRSLWSVVGSGSSVAKRVHAFLAPDDPVHWLLPLEAERQERRYSWMLRVLDVEAALVARGYQPETSATVTFAVVDAERAENAGPWTLTVTGGEGAVVRADADPSGLPTLTARGLAALYAGSPPAALRRAGLLLGGGAGDDAVLELLFAGASPAYLLDYF